jgi:hypothetical protein
MRHLAAVLTVSTIAAFSSCSVVPDPTAQGLDSPQGESSFNGTWRSQRTTPTGLLSERLSLYSSRRYARWIVDSSFTSVSSKDVLLERGAWSYAPLDSSRLVLSPLLREIWTGSQLAAVASPASDTASWLRSGDTLRWILPQWSNRGTQDTIRYLAD